MGVTIISFVDFQMMNSNFWESRNEYKEDGVLKAIRNNAEIHLVAIDGTFRQMFFKENAIIRVVGNVIYFNSDDTDYLLTDHSKKFPENTKRNDRYS